MPLDPLIALGFRSPTVASTDTSQGPLATLTQLMGLRQLMGRLRGAQNLGGFMTGDVNAGQGGTPLASAGPAVAGPLPPSTAPAIPASTPPAASLPATGTGNLMTGLSRLGENVYSTDGGKTWFSAQSGQPIAGDIWGQTVI